MAAAAEEIIDILQLINSENLGPVTFYKLWNKYGSAAAALEAASGLKKVRLFPREKVLAMLDEISDKGIRLISFLDEAYPQALRGQPDMPPVLFARGDITCLNHQPAVSIVGARNASINGRKTASRIAYDLCNAGIMVVSGMARGIDAAAHKGAMYAQEQNGPTIAVLGTGIDIPYPDENKNLYAQIVSQGCVISEFLPGTLPQANNFPRRNKIVAALSQGTLVVEAAPKSGSLITARFAADYGRTLFAVPGSPLEARSRGPNQLIKDGAHLCETAADIVRVLHSGTRTPFRHTPSQRQQQLDFADMPISQDAPQAGKTKIIDYLNADGVYVDEIIRASGMSAAEVALALLDLEMSGQIERQSGNKVALIKRK